MNPFGVKLVAYCSMIDVSWEGSNKRIISSWRYAPFLLRYLQLTYHLVQGKIMNVL